MQFQAAILEFRTHMQFRYAICNSEMLYVIWMLYVIQISYM